MKQENEMKINQYITARQELKALMELSMHYNSICDHYPTDNDIFHNARKGTNIHSFFKLRTVRIHELLGDKADEFYDYWIGNGEPERAYKFAINNLKFEQEEITVDGFYEKK